MKLGPRGDKNKDFARAPTASLEPKLAKPPDSGPFAALTLRAPF
jgi:hypothetical protein